MDDQQEPAPLWITPLKTYQKEESNDGHYEVLQKLVTRSPIRENAEIETALEVFVNPDGYPLWRRAVVKSGPSCSKQRIHASYMLPEETAPFPVLSSSVLCWATFPDQGNHECLCVLSSPTMLCIWNVYPIDDEEATDSIGEGQTIPLPFEAVGIFPLGRNHGLFIQRKETMEDLQFMDYSHTKINNQQSKFAFGEEEEDGFLLKAPPRPVRLRDSTGNSVGSLNVSTVPTGVPSLFTLSHPLDDVLPVCNFPDGSLHPDLHPGVVTDVFEKIVYVGVLQWIDTTEDILSRKEREQPICVTYHTHRKRHAIWEIQESPPPPPKPPLWQTSGQWRSDNGWNSHLGVLQQDLEDLELLGVSDMNSSQLDATARTEALADALGVRKTPRKAVDDMAPRNRGLSVRANRNRGKSANNNASLLSPLSRHPNESHMVEVDTSVESSGRPALLNKGPFSSLHPKFAMTCLYEDSVVTTQAEDIFLATNVESSGKLMICLVCPGKDPRNPNDVRLFSLQPPTIGGRKERSVDVFGEHFIVKPELPIPCVTAKPIEAFPIPKCFVPHQRNLGEKWNSTATDILLLRMEENYQMELSLYRGNLFIVKCALSEGGAEVDTLATIRDIAYPAGNRIDIVYEKENGEEICVRGSIPLYADSSSPGDRVIQTLEAVLVSFHKAALWRKRVELALKIRSDCIRLEQAMAREANERLNSDCSGSSAVSTVILALFSALLQGLDVNSGVEADLGDGVKEMTAWEKMMQSDFHRNYSLQCEVDFSGLEDPLGQNKGPEIDWPRSLLSQIYCLTTATLDRDDIVLSAPLFESLHMLYEDYKVRTSCRDAGMHFVGSILCRVCDMVVGDESESSRMPWLYLQHYRRDMGSTFFEGLSLSNSKEKEGGSDGVLLRQEPPCIMSWVDGLVSGNAVSDWGYAKLSLASVTATCTRTRSILRLYRTLFGGFDAMDVGNRSQRTRDYEVVQILIEEGFTEPSILRDELPVGIAVPLLEVLQRCRMEQDMPNFEDPRVLFLLGREDLRRNVQTTSRPSVASFVASSKDTQNFMDHTNEISNIEDKDRDGICQLEITSSMLYPEDNRIREVGRLLRSSRPVYLSVPRAIEVSDHEYERLKQDKLLLLSRRVLALPVGRGMLTVGNLQPVPAEPLPLPDLCLVGRVPPTNAMLALDTTECAADLKIWPEFHNGVAAGLRLPLHDITTEHISKITRTWIVYNRPPRSGQPPPNPGTSNNSPSQSLGHSHGGLLMALGLRGHLTTLEMTDIFDYLTQGSVTTTVGVLLGMAANMRGTCDISVSKMLCLHIPSLIPQHFSSIDVASTVQAAAVAGAGLLYQGSSHRMMTEFLLNEIGKRPSSDVNVLDRDAYTLSCGIALGMVNLCKGGSQGNSTEGSGNAGLSDLRIDDRLYRYVVGGLDDAEMRRRREESDRLSLPSASTANNNEKCSCVFEGNSINTDVTAPGATLALGLIYMKSGNKTMSSAIALPDTNFLLEYVRPDFLMLRVISRALILWEDVEPSKAWIDKQVPAAVQSAYNQMRVLAQKMSEESNQTKVSYDKEYDRQAVRLIYTHVIAGACFALGLRFAGTANGDAVAAILERVMELKDLRDGADPASCALRPAVPVLEMCLGCAALSLSMVLAGTGDLETLKLLKILRWRCDEEINYGNHMSYGAAIGLLFLGGGTCTIGREPEDIAALIMAFYPRYPSTTSDNQYHLQALRNLYALAIKRREIRAIDVDTGESVFVPVQVHFEDEIERPLSLTSPCLLCNTDAVPREIRVVSERYYPVTYAFKGSSNHIIFYVKKRSAHLSYRQDPHSQRSLLVQTGSFQEGSTLQVIESFTDDQKVLAFSQHLCDVGERNRNISLAGPFSVAGFCRRVLHECLVLDTEEVLPIYLSLRSIVDKVRPSGISVFPFVWDFRLIRSYYENRARLLADDCPSILNRELVSYLIEMFESALRHQDGKSPFPGTLILDNGPHEVFYAMPIQASNPGQMIDGMDVSY